ncbi:hypothetical protein DKX38_025371 [Salix brachista]|uniref:Uncharacterized protein n=1 Tax=Salix brachista TaxID=2182728 RepID=A0A5N5JPI6_9ROSI|nr:hypothetical protein DKX38_025371 [Salix brachista]
MISTRLIMESNENGTKAVEEPTRENIQETGGKEAEGEVPKEEVAVEVEDKTGGMYADNEKLKDLMKSESSRKTDKGHVSGASDDIKLTTGSVIEISRLMMDEVVSRVENELCRAFIQMYLGDDPFDKDAKEKFGMSFLSLF